MMGAKFIIVLFLILFLISACAPAMKEEGYEKEIVKENISKEVKPMLGTLKWLGHASFMFEQDGKVVYIDPYKLGTVEKKADIVFITHTHFDHLSIEDLEKVVKPETIIVATPDAMSKLNNLNVKEIMTVEPGRKYSVEGIEFETVPAYNINKNFHPRDNDWVGYIINTSFGKLYHAGDTDLIPEMDYLKGKVDIALLPAGGTYTMNAEEAARAAEKIMPKVAVPMHWGTIVGTIDDAKRFVQLLEGKVEAVIMEKKE